jgi:hemolysin D
MSEPQSNNEQPANAQMPAQPQTLPQPQKTGQVIQLRPPNRWHDPLRLIQEEPPSQYGRIVLWTIAALVLILIIWAAFGQLDIIATAEGKLVPQTLVKIVQPADSGVVKELLVNEGDSVTAGQVLARLDTTLASADKTGISSDLAIQQMQARRLEAELTDKPMLFKEGDDSSLYAQIQSQYVAHRRAYLDSYEQEKAVLDKVEHERRSAAEVASKLAQTQPTYQKVADAYTKMAQQGLMSTLSAAEKEREALEKLKDLHAQQSTVSSLSSTIAAQKKKISQIQSAYKSDLQKELAEVRAKIAQLKPTLDKSIYKEGLMELRAPQDGVIKDLATTTLGAVVQPGAVVLTLVPKGEQLYADVSIKNEDVGFTREGQTAQIKLVTYPFQRYGMMKGTVVHLSADSSEVNKNNDSASTSSANKTSGSTTTQNVMTYKARIKLDAQTMIDPQGKKLEITPGMQIVAEINQGKRTVLEYLLSPVQKAVQEAGRER